MPSIVGTWRLAAVHVRTESGEALPSPFGDHPIGAAVFTEDWMMASVVPPRGDGTRSFISYHGPYSCDGTTLTTHVAAATTASWVGGDQLRECRFEGDDRVFLRPPVREFGGRRVQQELEWVRLGPASS